MAYALAYANMVCSATFWRDFSGQQSRQCSICRDSVHSMNRCSPEYLPGLRTSRDHSTSSGQALGHPALRLPRDGCGGDWVGVDGKRSRAQSDGWSAPRVPLPGVRPRPRACPEPALSAVEGVSVQTMDANLGHQAFTEFCLQVESVAFHLASLIIVLTWLCRHVSHELARRE
jgi:hypothetical protein